MHAYVYNYYAAVKKKNGKEELYVWHLGSLITVPIITHACALFLSLFRVESGSFVGHRNNPMIQSPSRSQERERERGIWTAGLWISAG